MNLGQWLIIRRCPCSCVCVCVCECMHVTCAHVGVCIRVGVCLRVSMHICRDIIVNSNCSGTCIIQHLLGVEKQCWISRLLDCKG